MKNKRYFILALFALTCLAQWYILSQWVFKSEHIKNKGTYIKIPCTQFDPIDPLRGTFLNISPDPAHFQFTDSAKFINDQNIWVNYKCVDGHCSFYSVQPAQEAPTEPIYIRCQVQSIYPNYIQGDSIKTYVGSIVYPFTQYYINEKEAPALAEKYNKAVRDTSIKVYAGLHVTQGEAILDAIWIGDEKLN